MSVAALTVIATVVLLSFYFLGGAAPRVASAPHGVGIESTTTQQWAFGGVASASFSCADSSCFSANITPTGNVSLSLSYNYYIEWVVIYTQTNISATQTQVEGQAALNVSAAFHFSTCTPTPCGSSSQSSKLDLILTGLVTATGFSNLTTGTVNLTHAGSNVSSSAPAIAVMNSQSNESINFSGSYSFSSSNKSIPGGTIGFDIGQSESSGISFSPALGMVPTNPLPGDNWTATSAYAAHGTFTAGHILTYSGLGGISNWTHASASPSGSLTVNGTDLGSTTLWDNYTNPPTSVTAQDILLEFSSNNYSAIDGWMFVSRGGSAGSNLPLAPRPGTTSAPALAVPITPYQMENAYYRPGPGFVGAEVGTASGTSVPLAGAGTASPSVHLQAGPEPVSVAEQQYQAITAPRGGPAGTNWLWLVLAVVVAAAVAVAVALLIWKRSARRRRPPTTAPMPATVGDSGNSAVPYVAPPAGGDVRPAMDAPPPSP